MYRLDTEFRLIPKFYEPKRSELHLGPTREWYFYRGATISDYDLIKYQVLDFSSLLGTEQTDKNGETKIYSRSLVSQDNDHA